VSANGQAASTTLPAQPRLDAGVFVRGVAALMISQGFTWIATAVITFTLPRFLGSANLGKYSFAVAVFGLAELGADLGIGTYLNRQVARDPAGAPRLVTAALASRFALGGVAAAALFAGFHVFGSDPVVRLTIDVLCVNVLVDTLAMAGATLNGWRSPPPSTSWWSRERWCSSCSSGTALRALRWRPLPARSSVIPSTAPRSSDRCGRR
jgi:hypothetical protein